MIDKHGFFVRDAAQPLDWLSSRAAAAAGRRVPLLALGALRCAGPKAHPEPEVDKKDEKKRR